MLLPLRSFPSWTTPCLAQYLAQTSPNLPMPRATISSPVCVQDTLVDMWNFFAPVAPKCIMVVCFTCLYNRTNWATGCIFLRVLETHITRGVETVPAYQKFRLSMMYLPSFGLPRSLVSEKWAIQHHCLTGQQCRRSTDWQSTEEGRHGLQQRRNLRGLLIIPVLHETNVLFTALCKIYLLMFTFKREYNLN